MHLTVFLRRVAVMYPWHLCLEAEGRSQAELCFLLRWLGRCRAQVSPRDAHTSRAPAALMLTVPRKGGITLSWWGELFKFLAILLSPGSLQHLWQLEMKGGARPLRAVAGAVPPALLWFPASAPFWHAFLASYTSIFQLCVMSKCWFQWRFMDFSWNSGSGVAVPNEAKEEDQEGAWRQKVCRNDAVFPLRQTWMLEAIFF